MSVLIGGSTENSNIIVSKNDCKSSSSCVGQYLKTKNYLSEFKTAYEKALARENLGIDEIKAKWGEIEGYLSQQQDLMEKFQEIDKETSDKIQKLQSQIEQSLKELTQQFVLQLNNKISKENIDGITAVQQINYDNEQYPEIHTLEDALNKLLYIDLTVNLQCAPNLKEVGEIVSQIRYDWTYNKNNIKSQIFDGKKLDYTVRTYTIDGPFTSDTSKTLESSDGINVIKTTATLKFYSGLYYGSLSSTSIDNSQIQTLNRLLQSSRKSTVTVDATSNTNTYIYICIPYSYGVPTFTVNGFDGGFTLLNDDCQYDRYNTGNPVRYRVYRSDYGGLGNTTITIS